MLRFEVLTLFPEMVRAYLSESILGKAQARDQLQVNVTDIRDFAQGKHRVTDDTPYGGGPGMVMKVEPIAAAIDSAKGRLPQAYVVLTSPRGRLFDQRLARQWAENHRDMILVCGRYEGVDERVLQVVDDEISVGDVVLTGGELAALTIIDATARLSPGVLGNDASPKAESFENGLLEYGQFTRPAVFDGLAVPAALQSGDHARIARWRRWHSLRLTRDRRPDLFQRYALTPEDEQLLKISEDDL